LESHTRPGKLIIISAPSGAGKTTIVKHLVQEIPELEFSISACSRAKRPGEIDGKDYYFLDIDDFKARIDNNEFLEWEEVYEGLYYGTLKSELDRIWEKGHHVLLEVDVKGGMNIKDQYPNRSFSLFIEPPDIETLHERLEKRGANTKQDIEARIAKAKKEMSFSVNYDKKIINNELLNAKKAAVDAVINFLEKTI
jgi:guanylate kinase